MVKDKIDYAKLLEMAPYLDESVYLYSETSPFKFVILRFQLRSVVERFGQQLRVESIPNSKLLHDRSKEKRSVRSLLEERNAK